MRTRAFCVPIPSLAMAFCGCATMARIEAFHEQRAAQRRGGLWREYHYEHLPFSIVQGGNLGRTKSRFCDPDISPENLERYFRMGLGTGFVEGGCLVLKSSSELVARGKPGKQYARWSVVLKAPLGQQEAAASLQRLARKLGPHVGQRLPAGEQGRIETGGRLVSFASII